MTTREEIVALARDCGIKNRCFPQSEVWGYAHNVEAFFHAAQRQAYERAAGICEAVADGWDKNPGRNPQAGYVASSNCATEIRALFEGDRK